MKTKSNCFICNMILARRCQRRTHTAIRVICEAIKKPRQEIKCREYGYTKKYSIEYIKTIISNVLPIMLLPQGEFIIIIKNRNELYDEFSLIFNPASVEVSQFALTDPLGSSSDEEQEYRNTHYDYWTHDWRKAKNGGSKKSWDHIRSSRKSNSRKRQSQKRFLK